jgi:CRISPR-associated protein Cas1
MTTLYIDRRGARLEVDGGTVRLELPSGEDDHSDKTMTRYPLGLIDRIVAVSRTNLDTSSLAALAEHGVSFVAFGGRAGERFAAIDTSYNDTVVRMAQTLAYVAPNRRQRLARHVVLRKLRAQRRMLRLALGIRPDLRKPITDALGTLDGQIQQILQGRDLPLPAVRGIEGASAAAYFAAYFTLFPPTFGVTRRQRRPAPDPINATLSLAYTLGTALATRAARTAGLDAAIGFLHAPAHGRPSLACDLIEAERPEIDRFVWRLFADRTLNEGHFGRDGSRACLLNKTGRSHFYEAWARFGADAEPRLQRLARSLAAHLRKACPLPLENDHESDEQD